MKTAYELAMERLRQSAPDVRLSPEQKRELAELEARYRAKIAERELALQDRIAGASAAGDLEQVARLEQQLVQERHQLRAELEEKKQQIRQARP